jgi:hypothetical protein
MNTVPTWILALSTLSFVLGFAALLSSKIYVTRGAKTRTVVHVPLIGRMTTNYPALVFVFIGAALAWLALERNFALEKQQLEQNLALEKQKLDKPRPVEWTVSGQLQTPDRRIVDWRAGRIAIIPEGYHATVESNGRFHLSLQIEEGQTFESFVELVDYTASFGSVQFVPDDDFQAYQRDKDTSMLEVVTPTTRKYKPRDIRLYP